MQTIDSTEVLGTTDTAHGDAIVQALEHFGSGQYTSKELTTELGALGVRGGIAGGVFHGYDYQDQRWLRYSFNRRAFVPMPTVLFKTY